MQIEDLNRLDDIEIEGTENGYPDFCDAFIASATLDGEELTEDELDFISDTFPDFVYDKVIESII